MAVETVSDNIGKATIVRDGFGVPHIFATSQASAIYALGFAMGEDRLWQLEYLRRAAAGRLSEVLGPSFVARDKEARLLGFARLGSDHQSTLGAATRSALENFSDGVNQAIAELADDPPPEFAHLEVSPGAWKPSDSLAVLKAFWWQLTGRLHQITAPELILRSLPSPLAEEVLRPLSDRMAMLGGRGGVPFGPTQVAGGETPGSNSWVLSPARTVTSACLMASDPHVALSAPSAWYEAQLTIEEAGSCAAGITCIAAPGFVAGRNRTVAWGLTNNICSVRDLYLEREGTTGFESRTEWIDVKGGDPVEITVSSSPRGPIVNVILVEPFRSGPPISLRWTGFEPGDEIGVMLAYERATTVEEFREALRGWRCPTWNFTFCDTAGRIGYQCVGDIPLRGRRSVGIRDARAGEDEWVRLVPTSELPFAFDPEAGYVVTANNRVSWEDPTLSEAGMWSTSDRAERIIELLEGTARHSVAGTVRQQLDVRSVRATRMLPALRDALQNADLDATSAEARDALSSWEGDYPKESVAATIFEQFFIGFGARLLAKLFGPVPASSHLLPYVEGYATHLISDRGGNEVDWANLSARLVEAFTSGCSDLRGRLGDRVTTWRWERVHGVALAHPLSGREQDGVRFGTDLTPLPGAWNTINNATYDPGRPYEVVNGVSHRLIADLSGSGGLLSANSAGASGDPRSRHHLDGFREWLQGGYHELWLSEAQAISKCTASRELEVTRPT